MNKSTVALIGFAILFLFLAAMQPITMAGWEIHKSIETCGEHGGVDHYKRSKVAGSPFVMCRDSSRWIIKSTND